MPPAPNPYEYADLLEPELKKLYLRLVKEARGRIPLGELQQALAARNQTEVLRIVRAATANASPATVAAWKAAIEEIFGRTALASASRLSSVLGFSFNMYDPYALGEIDRIVGEQVKVGEDTQQAIQNVVLRGHVEGITPYNQARIIRGMVGPAPQHSNAAATYLQGMLDAGVPEKNAVYNAELYQNRLVNWRATTISRTENIRAANAGRVAMWDQMVRDGILEQHRMYLQWNATDDDILCPYCAPMDGQEIPFGVPGVYFVSDTKGYPGEPDRKQPRYDSLKPKGQKRDREGRFTKAVASRPGGPIFAEYPPLHPNCRCDVRLILK